MKICLFGASASLEARVGGVSQSEGAPVSRGSPEPLDNTVAVQVPFLSPEPLSFSISLPVAERGTYHCSTVNYHDVLGVPKKVYTWLVVIFCDRYIESLAMLIPFLSFLKNVYAFFGAPSL